MPVGHLIFTKQNFKKGKSLKHDYLIVGGGIAGFAAACSLKDKDFILCELSKDFGGSSGSITIGGNRYAQGAHYDLAYPGYFGQETLGFLENLKITEYNSFTSLWEFRDKQYLINPINETHCLSRGKYRDDVLPDDPAREVFQDLLDPYKNQMKMPTRLITDDYHSLNDISFTNFLNNKLTASQEFLRSIDYNMTDDYGGTASEISALAGIHYYECRPYFYQPVELFSPPQGNYYFIGKMLETLPPERIHTGYLVSRIIKSGEGFNVEIIKVNGPEIINMEVNKIIYAGQKHALKYVFPEDHGLFASNQYAPWLVMNFELDNFSEEHAFWQNEILHENPNLLGFVDSGAQFHKKDDPHIITVYYCFKPAQRLILANINQNKNRIVSQTIRYLSDYFKIDMKRKIQKIYIKVMGHAMPVPRVDYLFSDKNDVRSCKNMVYAGVDNSRLPLLFEALDSGIYAADLVKE